MSVDIEAAPTTCETDLPPDLVLRSIDELLIGKPLKFPIYSAAGVLLLSEGSIISSEFKQKLKAHRVNDVKLHPEDAAALTLDSSFDDGHSFQFDTELTQKLDKVIDAGLLFVQNNGPAVKDEMVFHGRKAYDPEHRDNLIQQHRETSESLDSMIRESLHGGRISGNQVNQLAATYLTDMTADCDSVISIAFEANQQGISEHCLKMAILGMAIGTQLDLDADNIRTIGVAGLVCDWGMTKVPEHIRNADRVLSQAEFLEIQKHTIYSLDMLERVSGMPRVVPLVVYQTHESPNGNGYPKGKKGRHIHLFARILHVADAYIALTSPRPYRKALMPYAAMECLLQNAQSKLVDAAAVRALMQITSLFPIGSLVALNDGSIARVIRRNGDDYTTPIVQLIRDAEGNKISAEDQRDSHVIDLATSELYVAQALPTPGREEIGLSGDIVQLPRKLN